MDSLKADRESCVWNLEELETCSRLDMTSDNPMISKYVLLLKVNYHPLFVILALVFLLFVSLFPQSLSFSYL